MNRVAVVGAGPVGATVALMLARDEVPVILLDAKPAWQPEGSKAMVIAGHTFETFARLGLPELGRLFCRELPPPRAGEGRVRRPQLPRAGS